MPTLSLGGGLHCIALLDSMLPWIQIIDPEFFSIKKISEVAVFFDSAYTTSRECKKINV